jgi:2-oxoglutarate ferredoxin oxidoreductase subunit delta
MYFCISNTFGMKHNHLRKKQVTEFIEINSRSCEACWKCISVCPNEVIGKIDVFFHKHSRISKPDKCNGCMKCVKVCEYKAIRPVDKTLNIINHGTKRKKEII